jgi:hypothetical protein
MLSMVGLVALGIEYFHQSQDFIANKRLNCIVLVNIQDGGMHKVEKMAWLVVDMCSANKVSEVKPTRPAAGSKDGLSQRI